MRKLACLSAIVAICGLVGPVFADDGQDEGKKDGRTKCSCKANKATGNGWCGRCEAGAKYGVEIVSAKLYDALKGSKAKDGSKIKCAGCKTAMKTDGACKHCRVAFMEGKAYRSPVSHTLAHGKMVDAKDVKCTGCARAMKDKKVSFCPACDGGILAGRVFKGKGLFERAKEAMNILKAAATAARKCEACAVALVTDGTCNACKVEYKGGKKVKPNI